MFREMRRKRQALSREEISSVLYRGTSGVLALSGDDNAKVSFCVIGQDKIVPDEYTSYFRSVIAFGQIEIIKDEKEKRAAIEKLAIKYAPEDTAIGRKNAIDREWTPLCMLKMRIDHITGKEAVELIKNKSRN